MATINLGSIKFNWKGTYSGATAYVVDDVVESSGSSYICIAATTGNAPPNATYWEQMSSAGTNGTDGTDLTTTLTTQGDIVYRDGSGLARLGAGTSGQVLQTNGTGANPSWVDASAGIEEADMYRLTTSLGNSFNGILTNLERVDDFTFSKIGTGMSVSSGIFTFPSTGLYQITFTFNGYEGPGTQQGTIQVSSNSGSTYDDVAYADEGDAQGYYTHATLESFVNVTDASTFRVRFYNQTQSSGSIYGDTNRNRTFMKFIKLGDSQ